jgi:hypothetical protein
MLKDEGTDRQTNKQTGRQAGRQTDMVKIKFAFRPVVSAPKKPPESGNEPAGSIKCKEYLE